MDNVESAANIIKLIYAKRRDESVAPDLAKVVCEYFDGIKNSNLSEADYRFLRYVAKESGVPQYYEMLSQFQNKKIETDIHLDTIPTILEESSLYTSEYVQLHKYQQQVLSRFNRGQCNRYFLTASTSFGKTFLIYEVLRKMQYNNVCLIFPTIALLAENLQKIYFTERYQWIKDAYTIHTLSDVELQEKHNLFIYTPERFLSFLDKHKDIEIDFFFVDEVYKIDNEFLIDEEQQENERDVAYRIASHIGLINTKDCLLAGPYIKIDRNQSSSFSRFLQWARIRVLDYNNLEIVGKQEYNLKSSTRLRVPEFENEIRFSSSSKEQRFKELLSYLVGRSESTIVYCPTKVKVEEYAKRLIDCNDIRNIDTTPFGDFMSHLENMFSHGQGANWIVTRALQKGIGVHHGLVPKYIQNEIIKLFNDGILKVLLVTTTITEGVNTTAKNMVVLSHNKGRKELKSFDAKNIEGRAGRFIHHYMGRVFILDNKFKEIVDRDGELLRHKFFDGTMPKKPVDFPYVDPGMLTEKEKEVKHWVDTLLTSNTIPEGIINSYKTISPEDKYHLYESLRRLTSTEKELLHQLIVSYNSTRTIKKAGFDVICEKIKPIIPQNGELVRLIEFRTGQSQYSTLTNMVSVFLKSGFVGAVNYYSSNDGVDKAVRKSAKFIFNTLRYQIVKYVGLFNLCYKYCIAEETGQDVDKVTGFDSLLMRMEYNADTTLGRKASDAGASFKVVGYYDKVCQDANTDAFEYLDDYEKKNAESIREIVMG